jgi:transcription elongation factor GreA
MNQDNRGVSLGESAGRFLASLSSDQRGSSQPEISKFVRWFGSERLLAGLTAAEIDNYAERLSLSDIDYLKKLEMVKVFLVYSKKEGWSKINLASHLKAKKRQSRQSPIPRPGSAEALFLTRQGYAELEAELAALKSQRLHSIDEIRTAAADKDFRENVPLQAAREQRSYIEGRIQELEKALKSAVIIDGKEEAPPGVAIGDSVVLKDMNFGEEARYTLVSPKEVDLAKGKISRASPLGQAVIGKGQGDVIEVAAPAGRLRYQIKHIERYKPVAS